MKNLFILLVLSGLLLKVANSSGANLPETVTLSRKEAVERAIRNNLEVRNERFNNLMAQTDLARSKSLYNPMFSTTASQAKIYFPGETFGTTSTVASVGLSQNLPTGGSISTSAQTGYTNADSDYTGIPSKTWQSSVAVTLLQPLLKNFGKETTELTIRLAESNQQDSLERLHAFLCDTVLSVITSYNHLYSVKKILQSKVDALNSTQELLSEIKKRPRPGPKQKLEVANLEYAVSQRRKELVEAQRNVSDQEASFRYLIGLEEKAQIIPSDPPAKEEPPETAEQAVKAALEHRPDLRQLRLSLQSSRLQERVARHQMLPDLSVTASGGFSGNSGQFGDSFRQIGEGRGKFWSAGLQFSMPLGNTAAKNDYRRSMIRTEQAQNQIRALEWKIRNEVETDLRALISARLQRQTTEQALGFAEQRREEYRKHARAGEGAVQDLINADNDLTAARNAQLDALETFSLAVAKLWKDTGSLLDRQGVRVESAPPGKEPEPAPGS